MQKRVHGRAYPMSRSLHAYGEAYSCIGFSLSFATYPAPVLQHGTNPLL